VKTSGAIQVMNKRSNRGMCNKPRRLAMIETTCMKNKNSQSYKIYQPSRKSYIANLTFTHSSCFTAGQVLAHQKVFYRDINTPTRHLYVAEGLWVGGCSNMRPIYKITIVCLEQEKQRYDKRYEPINHYTIHSTDSK